MMQPASQSDGSACRPDDGDAFRHLADSLTDLQAALQELAVQLKLWAERRASAGIKRTSRAEWWRHGMRTTVASCLRDAVQGPDDGASAADPYVEHVKAPRGGLTPGVKRSTPGSRHFFVSSTVVVKAYCIGHPSQPLDTDQSRAAAYASIDAGATQRVCETMAWYCNVFGLLCDGLAYVCVARRNLQACSSMTDEDIGRFFRNIAIQTGVLHNDGHAGNLGHRADGGFEAYDFERASMCNVAGLPPASFYEQYAAAVRVGKSAADALMPFVAAGGLDDVHAHFKMEWRKGATGYDTAHDRQWFERSPVGSWAQTKWRQ
jgi:hypothetical protein